MDIATAAERIRALFPDGGAGLLAEANLEQQWETHLELLDATWLDVGEGVTEAEEGERLLIHLRESWSQQGALRPAIAVTRALIRRRVMEVGDEHPDVLVEFGALGALADRVGKTEEAEQLLLNAYHGLRSVSGGRDLRLAVVCSHLAWHCLHMQQGLEAEQYLEQALNIRRDLAPETTGSVAAQLAELLIRRQQPELAIPYLQEAFSKYEQLYGPNDARTLARARTLAITLMALGRDPEAVPVLRVMYDAAVREKDGEKRALLALQLGNSLEALGRQDEAIRLVNESVRWTRDQPELHEDLANRLYHLSRMMLRRGRPNEAEGLLLEALEADRQIHGDESNEVAMRYAQIGLLYDQLGRHEDAIGWLEPAVSLLRSSVGDEHWQTRAAVEVVARLWIARAEQAIQESDRDSAQELLRRALSVVISVLGPRHGLVDTIRGYGLT